MQEAIFQGKEGNEHNQVSVLRKQGLINKRPIKKLFGDIKRDFSRKKIYGIAQI